MGYNQGVTWNTSKDGLNHIDPGPSPGSYNQPSHTPDSGYSNNTPSANPINAPVGDDYTAWNWEQVLNGVLGTGSFGNLLSDSTWVAVESQAKQLWLNQIQGTLDTNARKLINTLTVSYLTTAGIVKAVTPPPLSEINPSGDGNLNNLNNSGLGDLNSLGDGLNNLGNNLGILG